MACGKQRVRKVLLTSGRQRQKTCERQAACEAMVPRPDPSRRKKPVALACASVELVRLLAK